MAPIQNVAPKINKLAPIQNLAPKSNKMAPIQNVAPKIDKMAPKINKWHQFKKLKKNKKISSGQVVNLTPSQQIILFFG